MIAMKSIKTIGMALTMVGVCAIGMSAFGQDAPRKFGVKLYSNFGWHYSQNKQFFGPNGQSTLNQKHNYFYKSDISPAVFLYRPNGSFHELELSTFSANKSFMESTVFDPATNSTTIVTGREATSVYLRLRYEYSFLLRKKPDAKFKPYIGVAASPFFARNKTEPLIASLFPQSSTTFGANLAIVPRINYEFSDRWFLDANVRLNIGSANIGTAYNQDPSIPSEQQRITRLSTEFFPISLPFRVGVGFKF